MSNRLHSARKTGSGDSTLVVLHGLGSNEQDLLAIAPMLDPALHVVAYRAPLVYGTGYSWFPIEFDDQGVRVDSDSALASLELLLVELKELRASTGKLIVGGFSQGAIMTSGVVAQAPELLDAAILLSGRLFEPFFAAPMAPVSADLPIVIQHGTFDPVLPIDGARHLRDALVGLGYAPDYHEYPMGHQVSDQSLFDLQAWMNGLKIAKVASASSR